MHPLHVAADEHSDVTIQNITAAANVGPGWSVDSTSSTDLNLVLIRNSIIWGNQGGDGDLGCAEGVCDVFRSDIGGDWVYPGGGNISANPMFVDPSGDYHLAVGSPSSPEAMESISTESAHGNRTLNQYNIGRLGTQSSMRGSS
ncbi:MAG: hypothetical protein BMS9Abin28_1663 [Anaerolineae bacterium]|nr:MAG: hypothetical protein BMS9Abin28_1663 [Anaerolineae bacterium]